MEQGHMTYQYFEGDGLTIELNVGACADQYRVTVLLNGVPARTARCRSLTGALRTGRAWAERQLTLLTSPPRQLALALTELSPRRALARRTRAAVGYRRSARLAIG